MSTWLMLFHSKSIPSWLDVFFSSSCSGKDAFTIQPSWYFSYRNSTLSLPLFVIKNGEKEKKDVYTSADNITMGSLHHCMRAGTLPAIISGVQPSDDVFFFICNRRDENVLVLRSLNEKLATVGGTWWLLKGNMRSCYCCCQLNRMLVGSCLIGSILPSH